MLVKSALVRKPLTVGPDTSLTEFIDAVLDSNQTTAAVIEGERLVGMVSAMDVFRRIVPPYLERDTHLLTAVRDSYFDEKFEKFRHVAVREIMVSAPDVLAPEESVARAVALFVHKGRKSLAVVDDGRYVGTITRRSILRTLRRR